MIGAETIIAQRYAQAFINVYGDGMKRDDFYALGKLEEFLATHKNMLFVFMISQIDNVVKVRALSGLFEQYKVTHLLAPLSALLVKDKRVFLLPEIVRQLLLLYEKRKKIMSFTFTSSHELEQHDVEALKNFLARQIGCDIIYSSIIDKSLIAGIRLQSDTLLWEYSIRKQLRDVALPLIR